MQADLNKSKKQIQLDRCPHPEGGKFSASLNCPHSSGEFAVKTGLTVRYMLGGSLLTVGLLLISEPVDAGCNCGRGGSALTGTYGPDVSRGYMGPESYMGMPGGTALQLPMTPDVGPPPGTLGQTYQRPMRPIPVDKHPRIGIIDVRAPGATVIKVHGTNEFRTKDGIDGFQDRRDAAVWRFESDPLMPGVPHIYRVVAKYGEVSHERYVRLVPGRIVTLQF